MIQKKEILGNYSEGKSKPKQKIKSNLNQIIQLTEENQTCRIDDNQISQSQQTISCLAKCFECLKRTIFMFKKGKRVQVDVNESQMSKLIENLRNKKDYDHEVVLPPIKDSKKTLVLDLDQTLVHTTFTKPEFYDFETEIVVSNKPTTCYTVKRFGLDNFLFEMSQIYEIVVFTAGQKQYADKIITKIDPKNWINHRLYRQHCIVVNKTFYLKNLRILGRNLKEVIIVDDNRMGGVLQPDNYYRIQPFVGNPKDRKLVRLMAFLKSLVTMPDFKPISVHRKKFQQRQIRLKQNILPSLSIEDRKKIYKHKKTNSETETLANRDENDSNNLAENTNTVFHFP